MKQQTWEERFLESFGHDHPWNGECASVNMGNDCDCRTKGMLMFIKAELQQQRREWIEMIEGMKLPNPNPYGKWVSITNVNKILDDIIKKVGGK